MKRIETEPVPSRREVRISILILVTITLIAYIGSSLMVLGHCADPPHVI
jgi:hypothetical protein